MKKIRKPFISSPRVVAVVLLIMSMVAGGAATSAARQQTGRTQLQSTQWQSAQRMESSIQQQTDAVKVTTRTGLINAVYAAEEGDVIYVGDIEFHDFQPGDQILNILKRITVDKSITIKSGKPDGEKAILSGGSFVLAGPIRGLQKITCTFENIVFVGGVDGSGLAAEDWDLVDTEPEPLKAQYAATFKGNVDAVFSNCDFTEYMFPYGGALWGRYSNYDWTAPGDFLYDYRDNKYCSLSISLADCNFFGNSAYYAGGAVYLEGEGGNVTLDSENCSFSFNNSSVGFYDNKEGYQAWYGEGGGAIYLRRVDASFSDCIISGNTANRVYGSATGDRTYGGGITCHGSTLNMTNCQISQNVASIGGGISLIYTEAVFDGCAIEGNSASTEAVFYYEGLVWDDDLGDYVDKLTDEVLTGLRTFAGFAGAVYIDIEAPIPVAIINSSICNNFAQNAYGGVYPFYADWFEPISGFGRVDMVFCDYVCNNSAYDYDGEEGTIWATLPGDIWDIPYFAAFGCVIVDDELGASFPRYEAPDESNGYNYCASPSQAADDGALDGLRVIPLFEIPAAVVKTAYDGRFENSAGQFYSGSNYNPEVKLRLDATGGTGIGEEIAYRYGKGVELPEPSREGYAFEGWHDSSGAAFVAEQFVFAAGIETFDIYAKWAADENAEQNLGSAEFAYNTVVEDGDGTDGGSVDGNEASTWLSTVLIIIGAVAFAAAVAQVILQRRRKSAAAGGGASQMPPNPDVNPEGGVDQDLAAFQSLTAREKEVANLLVKGKSQKEIADELYISTETVKTHIKNLYSKLGVKSRYELYAKVKQGDGSPAS